MVRDKKLTNMVWRSMGESILLCYFLFGVIIYFFFTFIEKINLKDSCF